jgi:hypothetical protein
MSQPAPTILGALALPLSQSVLHSCRPGPYLHGSDNWTISVEIASSVAPPNLVAYKNNVRWIAGPATTLVPVFISEASVYIYYRGSGTVIDIGYQAPDLSLNSITFDMSTGAFGSVVPTGVTVPIGSSGMGLTNLAMLVQPSGHLVMVYSQYGLPLFAMTFSSGSWHTPIEIDDGSAPAWYFENAVIDGSGDVGIVYEQGLNIVFRSGNKLYARFDGTSVLSRQTTSMPAHRDSGVWCAPLYDSTSDSVVFPALSGAVVGGVSLDGPVLLIGTPSASPVFTVVLVAGYTTHQEVSGDSLDFVNIVGNSAGNSFTVFWFYQSFPAEHYTVQQSSSKNLMSGWSAPSLYYDESTTPPAPPSSLFRISIFSNTLTNGSIGVLVGLRQVTPVFAEGVLYTWPPAAPPSPTGATITAVQVITGGTASPTTVTAMGPTSQSGSGGFGPVGVGIGTYVLTQVPVLGFPAGAWVLSGTGGALVGNVLTVANGDNVTVTITNTFVAGALTIGCIMAEAIVGVPFDEFIPVSGGVPPYTFGETGLPPGLSLNTSTGEITGTPTGSGTFAYTVSVTDS